MAMAFLVYGKKCDYCHSYFSSLVLSKKVYLPSLILVPSHSRWLKVYLPSMIPVVSRPWHKVYPLALILVVSRLWQDMYHHDWCFSSLLFGTSLLPPKTFPPKNRAKKKDSKQCITGTKKKDSPCSGHSPVQELKHRKGQSPHQPKSTKRVPV